MLKFLEMIRGYVAWIQVEYNVIEIIQEDWRIFLVYGKEVDNFLNERRVNG